jgi:hypothetical protein
VHAALKIETEVDVLREVCFSLIDASGETEYAE